METSVNGTRAVCLLFVCALVAMFFVPRETHAFWRGFPFTPPEFPIQAGPVTLCTKEMKVGKISFALLAPAKCTVKPPPVEEPTVDISANPSTINKGESAVLTWNSTHATSCTASGAWSGTKTEDGSTTVSPTETSTYAIDCTGAGGSVSDSVTVTVTEPAPPAPNLDFTANPTTINEGDSSTLRWDSTNADTCTASDGWSGSKNSDGTLVVSPTATTTYALTCEGEGGSVQKSVTVNVVKYVPPPAPTLSLSANPLTVHEGSLSDATTTLTWDSANAAMCTASGASDWTGTKALDGTHIVTPTADTTYEMDCSGAGGSIHAEVHVDFVPVELETIGHLVISEVYYDVASTTTTSPNDSSFEWVELYNGSNAPINLQGWKVGDASSTDAIVDSVTLQPGEFAVVVASTTPAGVPEGVAVVILHSSIGNNGFANGGDGAVLLNPTDDPVDTVGYGTNISVSPNVTIPSQHDGHSIHRTQLTSDTNTASDWVDTDTPTPGH